MRRAAVVAKRLIFFLNDCLGAATYLLNGRKPREGLTVLCYHRLASEVPRWPPFNPYNVRPDRFEDQLDIVTAMRGTRPVSLREVIAWLATGDSPRSGNAFLLLTFDDCWHHVVRAAEGLARRRLSGAFFVPTGYVGKPVFEFSSFDSWYARQPDAHPDTYLPITLSDCLALVGMGMDVQPHGHHHGHLGRLPEREMRDDVQQSVRFIEREVGREVVAFCYPFGSSHLGDISDEVVAALRESGVRCAFSTDAGINPPDYLRRSPYALKRIPVNEYDRGLLFEAKAAGHCGALPALKALLHRLQAGRRHESPPVAYSAVTAE